MIISAGQYSMCHIFHVHDFEMCRKPNVTRALCPLDDNVMCANLKANMGIEPVCENHELCSIKIFGGPRKCSGDNILFQNILFVLCDEMGEILLL